MNQASPNVSKPYRKRSFRRLILGLLLIFMGAGIAIYGLWIYRVADGFQVGQQTSSAAWYHPEQTVVVPLLKRASQRHWQANEIASALNQTIKWVTLGGVAFTMVGLYVCISRRRRELRADDLYMGTMSA